MIWFIITMAILSIGGMISLSLDRKADREAELSRVQRRLREIEARKKWSKKDARMKSYSTKNPAGRVGAARLALFPFDHSRL